MLHELTLARNAKTFSVSAENPTGEKGGGARATEGTGAGAARDLGPGWKVNPFVIIEPGETAVLADCRREGAVKHIWCTDNSPAGRRLILRLYFDGSDTPAVEVPLSDFFCNADYREFRQLSSLAVCYNPNRGMNCYFEMPFRRGFRATVENRGSTRCSLYYQIDCEERPVEENALYFHAGFRRENPLPDRTPFTVLDTVTGRGAYVGTYIYWGTKSSGWWGEGEMKFYIDGDSEYPTVCGTGTEDYFCGAYSFEVEGGYREFSTPYSGMHKVDSTDGFYRSQRYFNLYRWHITDPVYFDRDIRVTIQALGWREGGRYLPLRDDISAVAYWYSDNPGRQGSALPGPDALEIV